MAKVMLVEDDNNLREIYQARLEAEGYQIVSASDGEEALVVAKAEKPDLVISDVMMPKISGFEMLDILRNTAGLQAVKVIMLTALGQSDDQDRATKLGADRYLVKSQVTLEDIVKTAHELLQDAPSETASAPAAPADVSAEPPAIATSVAPAPAAASTPPADTTPAAVPVAPAPEPVAVVEPPAAADVPIATPPADSAGGTSADQTAPATDQPDQSAAVNASNDQLVADAASTLVSSTSAAVSNDGSAEPTVNDSSMSHNKVIAPLEPPAGTAASAPTVDLTAAETADEPAPTPSQIITPTEPPPAAPAADPAPADQSNVAL